MDASDQTKAATPRLPNFRWRIIPAFLMFSYGAGALVWLAGTALMLVADSDFRRNQNAPLALLVFAIMTAVALVGIVSARSWLAGRWKRAGWSTVVTLLLAIAFALVVRSAGLVPK